jgi:hypothetical protein
MWVVSGSVGQTLSREFRERSGRPEQETDTCGETWEKFKGSWGLAHPMSLTEQALLDGRKPLPLGDVIGLTLTLTITQGKGGKEHSSHSKMKEGQLDWAHH